MAAVVPFIFAGLGAAALVRGLFRPHRAVLKEGSVARCSGRNHFGICDPTDTIRAPEGTPAYAVAPGRVVAVGEAFVQIVARNDAVVLMYEGIAPEIVEGQHVGRGQTIGKSIGPVIFGVWQLAPNATGPVLQNIPPSAWLAARGMRHVVKDLGDGNKWCEGGRKIHVPREVKAACGFRQPDPSRFGLFPVEITLGEE